MEGQGERLNLADHKDYQAIVEQNIQMLVDMEKRLAIRELRKDTEYSIQVLHDRLKGYYNHVFAG